jgi:phosphoheptose isomerase
LARSVSVSFGARFATVFSPFVSATTGPAISSISPTGIARGATVTMTINGANLAGASAVRFSGSGGGVDAAISATNLTVNASGTQLIATVTVSSGAATGTRVVIVTATAGAALPVSAGANTITIQ